MAIILKTGKTYKDKMSIEATTGYYGVIKKTINVDYKSKVGRFDLLIYKSKEIYEAGIQPIEKHTYAISGDTFDEYLSISKLNESGMNQIKSLYEYVLVLETNIILDSNDTEIPREIVWADWESDE